MRLTFCHRRRPKRPFEDSDLAVAQFVFLTAALRLWHALDENDE
jgi:hypothetical protein